MKILPPKRVPGEFIRAEEWNQLIDFLAAVPEIRGGAGIAVKQGYASVIIALAGLASDYASFGRITAVQGADGDRKGSVTYDAQPFSEGPDSAVSAVHPRYLQLIPDEAAIVTAQPGDLCVIIRVPNGDGTWTADLAVLTERMMPRICTDPPGGISGGPGGVGALGVLAIDPVTGLPFGQTTLPPPVDPGNPTGGGSNSTPVGGGGVS